MGRKASANKESPSAPHLRANANARGQRAQPARYANVLGSFRASSAGIRNTSSNREHLGLPLPLAGRARAFRSCALQGQRGSFSENNITREGVRSGKQNIYQSATPGPLLLPKRNKNNFWKTNTSGCRVLSFHWRRNNEEQAHPVHDQQTTAIST